MFIIDTLSVDYNYKYYNVKVKKFGTNKQVIVYSKPIAVGIQSPFKGKTKDQIIKPYKGIDDYKLRTFRSAKVSSKRSKNKVFDYSRSNDWELFVTMTFNPKKVNSFKYEDVSKELSRWIDKMKHRKGFKNMKYVFVPELHKSGRYHFHGIISNHDFNLVDSGKRTKDGQVIYNIGDYDLGFTTATIVRDSQRVQKYIAKYITKELAALTKGKKRYWHSRNCNVPEIEYCYNQADYENGVNMEQVFSELHDTLISENGFVYGQEKEYIDRNGKTQFVRYYEFQGSEVNENKVE